MRWWGLLVALASPGVARGESVAPWDVEPLCASHATCPCGHSCVFGYCRPGTAAILGAACDADAECQPRCSGYACVEGRCAVSDAGAPTDLGTPPEEVGVPPIDTGPAETDVPSAGERDVVDDRSVPARDVPFIDERVSPDRDVQRGDDRDAATAGASSDGGVTDDADGGSLVVYGCAARPTPRASGATAALVGVLLVTSALRRRSARVPIPRRPSS